VVLTPGPPTIRPYLNPGVCYPGFWFAFSTPNKIYIIKPLKYLKLRMSIALPSPEEYIPLRREVENLVAAGLGSEVNVGETVAAIRASVPLMEACGLVRRKDGLLELTVRITPLKNKIILTDRLDYKRRNNVLPIYQGSGPQYLLEHMPSVRGRALDIGSGSGVFSIFAADLADSVVAVDVNDRAVLFTRLNAILNGCDQKIDAREGNLYGPVQGERFQYIVSTLPFVPHPPGVKGAAHTMGGPDGLRLFRKIVRDMPQYLASDGYAQMYSVSFGWGQQTMVENILHDSFSAFPYRITLLRFYAQPLPIELYRQQYSLAAGFDQWVEYLSSQKFDSVHSVVVQIQPGERFELQTRDLSPQEGKAVQDAWDSESSIQDSQKELSWKKRFTDWMDI
jgi:SAM-dependent methyltransferase